MSYAYIDDVYDSNFSQLENDYNKIVENILGINKNKKQENKKQENKNKESNIEKTNKNYTRKIIVPEFTNKISSDYYDYNQEQKNIDLNDIEKTSKYIQNKYDNKNQKKIEKIGNKENFNNKEPTLKECEDFLIHLEKCSHCRMFLIKKFNLDKKPEDIKREKYLDIVIFALSGIFMLFLVDIILDFGKKLKK